MYNCLKKTLTISKFPEMALKWPKIGDLRQKYSIFYLQGHFLVKARNRIFSNLLFGYFQTIWVQKNKKLEFHTHTPLNLFGLELNCDMLFTLCGPSAFLPVLFYCYFFNYFRIMAGAITIAIDDIAQHLYFYTQICEY